MSNPQDDSPRRSGIREGVVLITAAVVLSPVLFALSDLLPSRENTSWDELPSVLFSAVLVGMAVIGAVRIGYTLLTEAKRTPLGSHGETERLLQSSRRDQLEQSTVDQAHPDRVPRSSV